MKSGCKEGKLKLLFSRHGVIDNHVSTFKVIVIVIVIANLKKTEIVIVIDSQVIVLVIVIYNLNVEVIVIVICSFKVGSVERRFSIGGKCFGQKGADLLILLLNACSFSLKHERISEKPQCYNIIRNSNTDLGSNSNLLILR